jgi:hypothetical protein
LAEAHNHEFVPQAYLRAFAEGTGRQARIWAFDRVDRKAFHTLVRNVASQRDFNRIEADGVDPNALEQAFGQFEGSAAAALQRIQEAGSFAVEEDRLLVLTLIAILSVGLERDAFEPVLRTLAARKWTLVVAGDKAGNFVTSDHPVCLIDISERPSSTYGVGFGMTESAALFPVSKRLLLSGRFEGNEAVRAIGPVDVARVNAQIIQGADRQVFAYDASFTYLTRNGLMKGSQLVSDPFFQPRQA